MKLIQMLFGKKKYLRPGIGELVIADIPMIKERIRILQWRNFPDDKPELEYYQSELNRLQKERMSMRK